MGCWPNHLISVFQTQANDFHWILMGWLKKSPASAGHLQPCNKAYNKVCQYFSHASPWLSGTDCREDWLVLILSCTQEGQRRRVFPCPCQQSMCLAVRPGPGWRAGFGAVLSLPYKVQEEKFVCKIMFCVNYFASTMTVDIWIGNCT